MNKESKKILIIVSVAILLTIGIIVFIYYNNKKSNKILNTSNESINTYSNNNTPTNINPNKILHIGDSDTVNILQLQKEINKKLSSGFILEDGDFGNQTNQALKNISGNTLESSKNNVSINSVKSLGVIYSNQISNSLKKVYSSISGASIYDNINDFFPSRYAGFMEYIGDFSKYDFTYLGNEYAVTNTGRAIKKTDSVLI